MNQADIEQAATQTHACPNVRKGVRLLHRLIQAVNAQSDGWAYWAAPSRAASKLMALLQSAGNLSHGTHNRISDADLARAITPIKAMVTRQKKLQAKFGNTFDFDVQAALIEKRDYAFCEPVHASSKAIWHIRELTEVGRKLGGGADTPSLCGLEVARDLPVPVSELMAEIGGCKKCLKLYREVLKKRKGVMK